MPRKSKSATVIGSTESVAECYSSFAESSEVPMQIAPGKEWIMAVDPGKVNFAFLIEEVDSSTLTELKSKCPKKAYRFEKTDTIDDQNGAEEDDRPQKRRRRGGKKRGADMEPTQAYTDFLEEFYHCGRTVLCANHSVDVDETKKMRGSRCLSANVFQKLTDVLDTYRPYLDKVSTVIIEQQMSYGSKINTMAIKIAQHTYSYFLFRYGMSKTIVEFPSYNKTQLLGAPAGLEKPQRKKWAIEKANEIWTLRGDLSASEYVTGKKKKDDMSDCLLHVLAFLISSRFE